MTAIEIIDAEVRDVVRREGLDPVADPGAVRTIVDRVVASYDERSLSRALPPIGDSRLVARTVLDAVAGFGPLQPYLDDPTVGRVCQVVPWRRGMHRGLLPNLQGRAGPRRGGQGSGEVGPGLRGVRVAGDAGCGVRRQ